MKRFASVAAILGLAAVGVAAVPHDANAWWRGGYGYGIGVYVPPIYLAPPAYYAPPRAYYAPPPVAYYAPPAPYYGPPQRYWVRAHWDRGYWVPGHWD